MNFSMVKRLILKDWYLQRWLILGSLPAGAITLGIIAIGGNAGFFLGILLLVTVIIAVGGQLAVATMVSERKEQTLAFVISLPISYREYTAAKILGNLLIFLVPWITLVLGSFALLMFPPALHLGLIPFVAIMAAETFHLILAQRHHDLADLLVASKNAESMEDDGRTVNFKKLLGGHTLLSRRRHAGAKAGSGNDHNDLHRGQAV